LRSRRWRRAALGGLAAAAAVLGFLVWSRFEFRMEQHQLVVRWGQSLRKAGAETATSNSPRAVTDNGASVAREHMHVLSQLLHGQQDELDAYRFALFRLQNRLDDVQRTLNVEMQVWRSTERDVAALTGLQTLSPSKTGESHE
jgi:hypothetical protein